MFHWLKSAFGQRAATPVQGHPPPMALPAWSDAGITDEWFRSHFHYAADVVQRELGSLCGPATSTLLDFGCYDATTPLGLVLRHGWARAIAVDIEPELAALRRMASEQLGLARLPDQIEVHRIEAGTSLARFGPVDAVMSWSVFEHVERSLLDDAVRSLLEVLKPGGSCFIQIDPLFYSPQGSHLGRFATAPWAHLQVSEEALHAQVLAADASTFPPDEITEQFRTRSFRAYQDYIFQHYRELNRITADELVNLFERHGFTLKKQLRHRSTLVPSPELQAKYPLDDLLTHEIIAVFMAPQG